MRIGIDLDDTITSSFPKIVKQLEQFYPVTLEECLQKGIRYQDFYEMDHRYFTYVKSFLSDIMLEVPVKPGAREVLNQLQKEHHEIIIITARNQREYPDPYQITQQYLIQEKIPFQELYVSVDQKGKFAKEHHIDLFIDDSISNCQKAIHESIPVLLMDASYNQTNKKLPRVKNWQEVYREIQNMTNKKSG